MERPIEYWREMYCLHSRSKTYQKRLATAKEWCERFLELGVKFAVNLSGGKDSVALAHLVSMNFENPIIMSHLDETDFDGTREYVINLCSLYLPENTLHIPTHSINVFEEIKNINICEDIHSKGNSFANKIFFDVVKDWQKKNHIKGVFLGLRAGESNGRRINGAKNGKIYYNQEWDNLICQPIFDWDGFDVMAYLFSNNLPILPLYFNTRFCEYPHDIRMDWIFPSSFSSQGQAQWIKYYYPEIFTKLSIIDPNIRSYV